MNEQKIITTRLPAELHYEFKVFAAQNKITMAAIVRQGIIDKLALYKSQRGECIRRQP
jgi:hypothetical protein